MGNSRYIFSLARWAPWLVRPLMAGMAAQLKADPAAGLRQVLASFSQPDQALMQTHPELQQAFAHSLREAYRQGTRGVVYDMSLYARPWGFRLEDISLPVDVWQGEADTNVPVAMGQHYAQAMPNARARFFPGEGHLMFINHCQEIFDALLR
jgi:pimeloyl-ACP methyl ester carboxylesterase